MCSSRVSRVSRCSIQESREPLWGFFSSFRHPSFPPVAVRGSGIKPHCFYSISRHYQRLFDYEFIRLLGNKGGSELPLHPLRHKYCFPAEENPIVCMRGLRHTLKQTVAGLVLLDVPMPTDTSGRRADRAGYKGTVSS